jgi:hypothetical protein
MNGIALIISEIPLVLFEEIDLSRRIHERGGEKEVRFLYRHNDPVLPIWHEGQFKIVRWGNRKRHCRSLPPTGWTWLTTVEAGGWSPWNPELVDIPCNFGFENGVWFRIRQGVKGILVKDEEDLPIVYMICEANGCQC